MVTAGRTTATLIAALLVLSGVCPCLSAEPADLTAPAHECGEESKPTDEPSGVDCEASCSGASVVAAKQRVNAPATHDWASAQDAEHSPNLAPPPAEARLSGPTPPPNGQCPLYILLSSLTL